MFTSHILSRLAALAVAVGAAALVTPAAASAAPVAFAPPSLSSCAPGQWLTFTAERVAPDRIAYTTAAPQAQWNGAIVMWTNLTTGFQGLAFVGAPPAVVGTGPVVSQLAGLLPCSVSSGVAIS